MSTQLPPLLRVADVLAILRVSRPTLWLMRREGRFPPAIRISKNSIAWTQAAVEKWLRTREPA